MCQSCQDAMEHVQYAQFGDHYYNCMIRHWQITSYNVVKKVT